MPFRWDAEADRKLFHQVLVHKNLTFGNDDHAALAVMMGDGVSAGAIRNRLSGLKSKLNKEGVSGTASPSKASGRGSQATTPSKTHASKNQLKAWGSRHKTKHQDTDEAEDDEDEIDKLVRETKSSPRKRKLESDISIHEDNTAKTKIKREARDDSLELGSGRSTGDVSGTNLTDRETNTASRVAEEDDADEELYFD